MELNGSQIVLEVLKEQGVDTIFGYPGGTILNIFDELYKYGDTFKHILTPMSRARPTRQTAMPALPARWACALPPPVPAPPTW